MVKGTSSLLIDIVELSRQLQVKPATIYSWTFTRQVPFIKIGRLLRFEQDEVNTWLEQRKVDVRK